MDYINMKKFNKDKYLKKLRFKKYRRYLYIGIPCLLVLLIGIYFAYSKFSVSKDTEVVRTTVGDFISGDVVVGAYIDGKYSSIIPGKNDGYIVDKIVCDTDASASWNNDSWGIIVTNLTKRTKCNVYFETKKPPLTEAITTAMNSNPSMFAVNDPGKNGRYIGANPNNYVYFNCSDYNNQSDSTCEKWRIIGVFNDVTKSDGTKENLVKIIRDDPLGKYYWDSKATGSATTSSGTNDWTDSQLMMMLNPTNYLKSGYKISGDIVLDKDNFEIYSKMGSYYNGTKGCEPADTTASESFSCTEVDFTSNGLKNDITRNAIEEVVWNLGGSSTYDDVTPSMFYERERGTTVYGDHATIWNGKIGLMYPSDYGYATSGGTTKDRAACLAKELYKWGSSDFSDCSENDYLYYPNLSTLTPTATPTAIDNDNLVFGTGFSYDKFIAPYRTDNVMAVRPALFLKSNIVVKSGTGESSNPYQLKLGID